ncbi:LLM class flavin-dependent oxidoreductase [soil metagenome]
MELGIDSFATIIPRAGAVTTPAERIADLLDEIALADAVGVDAFGVGEHHRPEFVDSAPAIILAAAGARTKRIRLQSAVTVLGAADPVRVFQDFATLDLISGGRAEIVAGRGSSVEAYPLFGHSLDDRDALYDEKLRLLLALRTEPHLHWSGRFRAPLNGEGVYPRPLQQELPVWVGVGGTPASFARAGALGLPLMVAIIGGTFNRFRPLIELYRMAAREAGVASEQLKVGVHAVGFVGETDDAARSAFYPGWYDMWSHLGRERGWPPPDEAQFDALCAWDGPYLIGSVETVAAKLRRLDADLGGVARVNLQMSSAASDSPAMHRAIELLGQGVRPLMN